MDIKKVIIEEMDDFDWIRDIPAGVPFPHDNFRYVIDFTESKYVPEDLREKFVELFGNNIPRRVVNWFDNIPMEESLERGEDIVLYLRRYEDETTDHYVFGGWDVFGELDERNLTSYEVITPEQFLNFV